MGIRISKLPAVFLLTVFCTVAYSQNMSDQLKLIRSTVIDTIDGQPYYIHTIKRGQTLYMISKAYGMEVNDLIRENPGVKEGIRADEILRIPIKTQEKKKKVTTEIKPVALPPVDTVKNIIQLPCGEDNSTKKSLYNVALMIPLYLGEAESLNSDNPDRKATEESKCLQFLPFYEGFRIALDSLEHMGVKIKLFVYDVDKDTVKTRQLLKKSELKSMDLIIGLLYHQNFRIVADFALKNQIRLVNPLSERSEIIHNNPNIFKVQPDKESIPGILANYLYKTDPGAGILIVRNNHYPFKSFPEKLKTLLREKNVDCKIAEGQEAIFNQLSKETNNYIIAYGSEPDYILDFTRRLYELRNDYKLILMGLPDWHLTNGVESEYLVSLKSHAICADFINYEDPFVRWFVHTYQSQYKTDPEILAFRGFDVAWYFLKALDTYGTGFSRCLEDFKTNNLSAGYEFKQSSSTDGYENKQWIITKFENYRIVPYISY